LPSGLTGLPRDQRYRVTDPLVRAARLSDADNQCLSFGCGLDMSTTDQDDLRHAALEYHEKPTPGKIAIAPTKQLVNQRDLALAYSPGVAAASEAIRDDPTTVFRYTARGNLVGVVTNGTAVLGLGNIGPLAAKPVMEGKAVLFKKFAGIDVFDIELNELDPDRLIEVIAALEPTFGGINLEDIKAPECFYVERKLRDRLKIPVFHDDQHGTAIIVGAAIRNGLKVVGKPLDQIKLVTSGAGAAALACLQLLVHLGIPRRNIWVTDIEGVVYRGRTTLMDDDKATFAQETTARTLAEVIEGADVFLGLSAGGVLKAEMVARMAPRPLVLALANPTPEILPEEVKRVRDDAIIATGRSDYPNQVNNVLCFPFIFRGALDVGATTVTTAMELAAVEAIAALAQEEQSDVVASAYGITNLAFGPEYLIPRPFDPRLITRIAPAVAQAAMASGVATRPIADMNAYRDQLQQFVYHSGTFMKPIFATAKNAVASGGKSRIVFAEGEEERVLRAVQVVIDEKIAKPVLIGRPSVVAKRLERFGLRMRPDVDFHLINPEFDRRYRDYWETYHRLAARKGITAQYAKIEMRRRLTLIGTMMIRHARTAPCVRRSGDRSAARGRWLRGDEHSDAAGPATCAGRYPREPRSVRRADRRDHDHGGRADEAPRPVAEDRAAVALQFRFERQPVGVEDAARAGARPRAGARTRDRRRDACGRGDRRRHPPVTDALFVAERGCEPARVSEHRIGQHLVQPAEDDRRQ
jgi:malate dehydrogenase (oxaloacetate-decarboxylating)(NADP+)